jgi:hypothetical protein
MQSYKLEEHIKGFDDPCQVIVQLHENYWEWRSRQIRWLNMLSVLYKLNAINDILKDGPPTLF